MIPTPISTSHQQQNSHPHQQLSQNSLIDSKQWQRLTSAQKQSISIFLHKTKQFIKYHQTHTPQKQIILLTSGGTSVPMQKNTVRMLQNFSTGTRGSLLAQQILISGHPLIYFYRDSSCLPFLAAITLNNAVLNENEDEINKIVNGRIKLKQYSSNLLLVPFKTIYYYVNALPLLKQCLPDKSILILCAAVSDFIPLSVSQHKIHTQNSLVLEFKNSPKILGQLVDQKHLTISFKLETDPEKLNQRIIYAIDKYKVDMVVGNILNNKKWIKITINPKYSKNIKDEKDSQLFNLQFTNQIQKEILNSALFCHQLKFKK